MEKRAAEIVKQIQYTTLATVTPEGLPWNSPVARVYDQDLNFYWFSDKEGQHSRNIRANGQVFIVIYDSTVPWGEAIRRVYKAVPRKAWMNDAEVKNGVFIRDYRVELNLDKVRSELL